MTKKFDPNEEITADRFVKMMELELQQIAVQHAWPKEFPHRIKMSAIKDIPNHLIDALQLLSTEIAIDTVDHDEIVYPNTWLDALKARFIPNLRNRIDQWLVHYICCIKKRVDRGLRGVLTTTRKLTKHLQPNYKHYQFTLKRIYPDLVPPEKGRRHLRLFVETEVNDKAETKDAKSNS